MKRFIGMNINRKGMTLIEVMMSVFVLITTLSVILTAFVIARMSVARARHKVEARNILRAKMEVIKNTAYGNIASSGPETIIINVGPDLIAGTTDDLLGARTVTIVDNNGYKKITGVLSWKEFGWGGNISVNETLVTYITR